MAATGNGGPEIMDGLGSISLVDGWLPPLVWIVGIAGLIFLLLPRRRRRWWLVYPLLFLVAALITWAIYLLVVYVWLVIAEALPFEVIAWTGFALFGLLLGVYSAMKSPWAWKVLASLATIAVALLAGMQLNAYFGQYVTVRSLLGEQIAVSLLPPTLMRGGSGHGSAQRPSQGTVKQAPIPGTSSGFNARKTIIYLPPVRAATHGLARRSRAASYFRSHLQGLYRGRAIERWMVTGQDAAQQTLTRSGHSTPSSNDP